MRAAVHLAYSDIDARCPKCRGNGSEHLRRMWGCDEPANAPVFARTCAACSGYNIECKVCKGSGSEQVFRCPSSQISRTVADAFRAYTMLDRGFLPGPGSAQDQSAIFMDVVSIIDSERAVISNEQHESAERKAKSQSAKAKR